MEYFVQDSSIVRRIWGKSDTILFIFGGAAAEFALNKAVDWLYFTGKLPSDPLGRLFSTVVYARRIVFAEKANALKAIDSMRKIHAAVEEKRADTIPDWAYRDVLFMLIHYSIAAHELLEGELSLSEKEEVFDVFNRVGLRMGLKDLPADYQQWLVARDSHLKHDLVYSSYTVDLFRQYKKHLGTMRYYIMLQAQARLVPARVKELLKLGNGNMIVPALGAYKLTKLAKADWLLKSLWLPPEYKQQILSMDVAQ